MIRVITFLVVVAVIALGATWFADRPGTVLIHWPWLGSDIDLPLGFVVADVALFLIVVLLLMMIGFSLVQLAARRRIVRRFGAISRGLPEAGADLIELGVPFTDPMADGPIVQAAGKRALAAGVTVANVLAMVRALGKSSDRSSPSLNPFTIGAHPSAWTDTIFGRRPRAFQPIASISSKAFHMPTMPVPPPVG